MEDSNTRAKYIEDFPLAYPIESSGKMTKSHFSNRILKDNWDNYIIEGRPDIIVSNRALPLLFPELNIDQDDDNGYSIIEIKNRKLKFNLNGSLSNSPQMIQNKIQCIMYRDMLIDTFGDIYDYSNIRCYIMGKQMELGEVDSEEIVGFRKETLTEYYHRCIREYLYVKNIDLHGSSNPFQELCQLVRQNPWLGPNMSNPLVEWDYMKLCIALKTYELSLLPNLGPQKKYKLTQNGITSWENPSLQAIDLGYKNTKYSPHQVERINAIMDLHRFSTDDVYNPRILKPVVRGFIERVSPIEAFLDFETVNLNGGVCIVQIGTLMVGPGFQKYYSFMVNKINIDEELIIIKDWLQMLSNYQTQYGTDNIPIYHWTSAEKSFIKGFIKELSKVVTRSRNKIIHNLHLNMDNFKDLAQAYLKCPIVIRGVFRYSIKPIVKALYSMGEIPETWEDETVDGFGAGLLMVKANNECAENGISLCDTDIAQTVIKYNEIDCRSVYNLLNYIRGRYGLD